MKLQLTTEKKPVKLESSEGRFLTGRGRSFIIDKVPDGIIDLRDLQGMHVILYDRLQDKDREFIITGVEMFRSLDGMFRVSGPQSIIAKPVVVA